MPKTSSPSPANTPAPIPPLVFRSPTAAERAQLKALGPEPSPAELYTALRLCLVGGSIPACELEYRLKPADARAELDRLLATL